MRSSNAIHRLLENSGSFAEPNAVKPGSFCTMVQWTIR